MDIWNDTGISNKKTTHRCFEIGYLQIQTENGIEERKFNYETISNEIVEEIGILGDNIKINKVIYTFDYWLNFCKGGRVRFENGETMTINNVIIEQDSTKAQSGKNTIVGIRIIF